MGIYSSLIAPAVFAATFRDAEYAHRLGIRALQVAGWPPVAALLKRRTLVGGLETKAFGLTFSNPLGIAAGFDKHAEALHGAEALGVGHMEVGTITPEPQEGNARPRVFRNHVARTLCNRYGFNSDGCLRVAHRLDNQLNCESRVRMKVGINIGPNKTTPAERVPFDYERCIEVLYPFADYFTINISSPNTEGLRTFQDAEKLNTLLGVVQAKLYDIEKRTGRKIPFVCKVANDLPLERMLEVASVIQERSGDGMIIGNTRMIALANGDTAGESGPTLFEKMCGNIEAVCTQYPLLDIGAAGGISSPEDLERVLGCGAKIAQIYTAMVFQGPFMFARMNRHLARKSR